MGNPPQGEEREAASADRPKDRAIKRDSGSLSAVPDGSNPWLTLPKQPPYVLPSDSEAIGTFESDAREEYRVQLETMPEPFFGNIMAPVVLLCLNPGFSERDLEVHGTPSFQALLRNNYSHGASPFPFYYLNPNFKSPGRDWWEQKLKPLMSTGLFTREELANSLLCVQYFPYHSRRFRHARLAVPSQEFGFGLVRSAIDRGAFVVVMRSARLWADRVPQLKKYSRTTTLNNPLNVVISPRNCARFDDVVAAIRKFTS